jgi:hypothetical protein
MTETEWGRKRWGRWWGRGRSSTSDRAEQFKVGKGYEEGVAVATYWVNEGCEKWAVRMEGWASGLARHLETGLLKGWAGCLDD